MLFKFKKRELAISVHSTELQLYWTNVLHLPKETLSLLAEYKFVNWGIK